MAKTALCLGWILSLSFCQWLLLDSWEGRASSVAGGESLVPSADTMAELKAMVDAADDDDDNDGAGARVPPAANWAITIPSKARAYLDQAIIGPQNVTVALGNYAQVRYVSQETGSDSSGNGSRTNPWAIIDYALSQITDAGPSNSCALLVAKGTYAGATIEMKEYVDDALPNNIVVLFKVSIDQNEWVAAAHWTPEDVEITMKKP